MDIVHPESAGVLIDRHRHMQAPFAYPRCGAAARVGRRLMKKESGDQGKGARRTSFPQDASVAQCALTTLDAWPYRGPG
jgi:hypothetical protein